MAENKEQMSNFEKALRLYFEEWSEQLDKELEEAEKNGELPHKTPEQIKEEANRIWELAHSEE